MDPVHLDIFVFDAGWEPLPEPEEPPETCSVPGCGHWESAHERNHCRTCHTVAHAPGAPYPARGACVHYYFPPRTED